MLVSVIVPVWNAAATLHECLAGLAAQEPVDGGVEWIFIDNNSTDQSFEILKAYPWLSLTSEPRAGAYVARNTGVAMARGDILAFIDPDCVPDRFWLSSLVQALHEPDVSVALGVRRPAPNVRLGRLLGDYEATRDEWILTSKEPDKYFGYTNNMAVRRSAWERYGPFVERIRGSDTIFVRRLVDGEGCKSVSYVHAMIVAHLEMDSIDAFFAKAFIYGRSFQSYQCMSAARPLSISDRITIFSETVRAHSYGLARRCSLAVLLMAGLMAWLLGRFAGRIINAQLPVRTR